jgi:type II restriction enzyme
MSEILDSLLDACRTAERVYCKNITANDVGATGGHQYGYLVGNAAWPILFDRKGEKGENRERDIEIEWFGYGTTQSRAKWYGNKTRREYRITRFGRGFPFLTDDNIGNVLVLVQVGWESYRAWVLSAEDDIEDFLASYGLGSTETNRLLPRLGSVPPEGAVKGEQRLLLEAADSFGGVFPSGDEMAAVARRICRSSRRSDPVVTPDQALLDWIDTEYSLFRLVENAAHSGDVNRPLGSVERLVELANTVLNRRKSRAGASFENQTEALLIANELSYERGARTERRSKPDFLLPKGVYFSETFPPEKRIFLGLKTTCKDRWRQVLSEADRIPTKHLLTLQQGVSSNQLVEMKQHRVVLVVPKPFHRHYPKQHRDSLLSVKEFLLYARETLR